MDVFNECIDPRVMDAVLLPVMSTTSISEDTTSAGYAY